MGFITMTQQPINFFKINYFLIPKESHFCGMHASIFPTGIPILYI